MWDAKVKIFLLNYFYNTQKVCLIFAKTKINKWFFYFRFVCIQYYCASFVYICKNKLLLRWMIMMILLTADGDGVLEKIPVRRTLEKSKF